MGNVGQGGLESQTFDLSEASLGVKCFGGPTVTVRSEGLITYAIEPLKMVVVSLHSCNPPKLVLTKPGISTTLTLENLLVETLGRTTVLHISDNLLCFAHDGHTGKTSVMIWDISDGQFNERPGIDRIGALFAFSGSYLLCSHWSLPSYLLHNLSSPEPPQTIPLEKSLSYVTKLTFAGGFYALQKHSFEVSLRHVSDPTTELLQVVSKAYVLSPEGKITFFPHPKEVPNTPDSDGFFWDRRMVAEKDILSAVALDDWKAFVLSSKSYNDSLTLVVTKGRAIVWTDFVTRAPHGESPKLQLVGQGENVELWFNDDLSLYSMKLKPANPFCVSSRKKFDTSPPPDSLEPMILAWTQERTTYRASQDLIDLFSNNLKQGPLISDLTSNPISTKPRFKTIPDLPEVFQFKVIGAQAATFFIREMTKLISSRADVLADAYDGFSIIKFGFGTLLDGMKNVLPAIHHLYGIPHNEVIKPRELMLVRYTQGRGHHLHVDNSGWTLNICLGSFFTGGDLCFGRDESSQIRVPQEPGSAILHRGREPHSARNLESGERWNLVVWYDSHSTFHQFAKLVPELKEAMVKSWSLEINLRMYCVNQFFRKVALHDSVWQKAFERRFNKYSGPVGTDRVLLTYREMYKYQYEQEFIIQDHPELYMKCCELDRLEDYVEDLENAKPWYQKVYDVFR